MSIFRVHGLDEQGEPRSIFVEAASEAVARNTAVREGLINTTRVELVEGDPDGDVVTARPSRAFRDRVEDKLRDKPVLTIAQGVFLGLLMWTVFVIVLGFFFSLPNVVI
jgi:hypothetical protein